MDETSSVEAVSGERDYERLFRESLPSLWRALYGFVGGRRQIAEDAIAEAFARASSETIPSATPSLTSTGPRSGSPLPNCNATRQAERSRTIRSPSRRPTCSM